MASLWLALERDLAASTTVLALRQRRWFGCRGRLVPRLASAAQWPRAGASAFTLLARLCSIRTYMRSMRA